LRENTADPGRAPLKFSLDALNGTADTQDARFGGTYDEELRVVSLPMDYLKYQPMTRRAKINFEFSLYLFSETEFCK